MQRSKDWKGATHATLTSPLNALPDLSALLSPEGLKSSAVVTPNERRKEPPYMMYLGFDPFAKEPLRDMRVAAATDVDARW